MNISNAVIAVLFFVLGAWAGSGFETTRLYTQCESDGFVVIQQSNDGRGGKVVLCTAATSEQLLDMYLQTETEEVPDVIRF